MLTNILTMLPDVSRPWDSCLKPNVDNFRLSETNYTKYKKVYFEKLTFSSSHQRYIQAKIKNIDKLNFYMEIFLTLKVEKASEAMSNVETST